jgi:hypothetical protein
MTAMVGLVVATIVAAIRDKPRRVAPATTGPNMNLAASDGFDQADPVDSFGTGDAEFDAFEDSAFK